MKYIFTVLIIASSLFNISDAQQLKIAHCLGGCPQASDSKNEMIIRAIYALSFNPSRKMSDWVAYRVTSDTVGIAGSLSRQSLPDPFIADTLSLEDFQRLANEQGLERSLLVPLISFAGTPYWNEVNYLTNVSARKTSLTRGAWYSLEWAVRNLVNKEDGLYVLAGPVYKLGEERDTRSSEGFIPGVAQAFYKIVSTDQGHISAYLFDQNTPIHSHHCQHVVSIDRLEALTGLDFFPENSQWPVASLGERLGCSE